jgi:hypothetical protein
MYFLATRTYSFIYQPSRPLALSPSPKSKKIIKGRKGKDLQIPTTSLKMHITVGFYAEVYSTRALVFTRKVDGG